MTGALPPTVDGRPADPASLAALALGNYGHFTTMRVEDLAVRGLSRHLDRLARDCTTLFGTVLDIARVRDHLVAALAGDRSPRTVRVTVFDPAITAVSPAADARPVTLITGRPAPPPAATPLRLTSVRYIRELPSVKHTGLLGVTTHRRAAIRAGHDDALLTTADGLIAEGTTWNIGFHDGTGWVWPRRHCLPGVTATLLSESGGAHRFDDIHLSDVGEMRTAVAVSAAGIRPVAQIDGVQLPVFPPSVAALNDVYHRIAPEPL